MTNFQPRSLIPKSLDHRIIYLGIFQHDLVQVGRDRGPDQLVQRSPIHVVRLKVGTAEGEVADVLALGDHCRDAAVGEVDAAVDAEVLEDGTGAGEAHEADVGQREADLRGAGGYLDDALEERGTAEEDLVDVETSMSLVEYFMGRKREGNGGRGSDGGRGQR